MTQQTSQTKLALAEHQLEELKKKRKVNAKSSIRLDNQIQQMEQEIIRLMDEVEHESQS